METLKDIIIRRIQKEGFITFEAFMDMALYYPDLGYYSSSNRTIGREGDFYTGPHLHPIFGAMIGKQLMEMWDLMERPVSFSAVEMGAGLGYLCKDILDYLQRPSQSSSLNQKKSDFLASLKYIIVEPFRHFREKQGNIIQHGSLNPIRPDSSEERRESDSRSLEKVTWVHSLQEAGEITGCIFSNELVDAFPVHLVEMEDELKEVYVAFDGKRFTEEKGAVSTDELVRYLNNSSIDLKPGYRTEINLRIYRWLEEITAALSRGFVLTIDYGYSAKEYYSDERTEGTLMCYHEHMLSDNLYERVGEQDITAHVNFSALDMWGERLGLTTLGYCPQGTYLIASGIDELIVELYADSPDYMAETAKIKGLIMPQGMGESHSVLAQYKGKGTPELAGFSLRNLTGSL